MRTFLRLGAVLATIGAVVSCASIWGFEDLVPAGAPDAAIDNNTMIDSGIKPSCNVDHPPAQPTTSDPTPVGPFVMAIDTLDMGIDSLPDGGTSLTSGSNGFDLDNVCTCNKPDQESCARPNAMDMLTCDDSQGRDDTGRQLLIVLQAFLNTKAFTNTGATTQLQKAKMGILVGVQNYNGTMNDPNVTLSVVPALGLAGDAGTPTWTTADKWNFYDDLGLSLNDPKKLTGKDPNKVARIAYVNNGTMVGYLDDLFLLLQLDVTNGNPLPLHLTEVVVSGTIKAQGNDWAIEKGRLSGRWATGDLLRAIGVWDFGPNGVPSGPLCPSNTNYYNLVKDIMCKGRDIGTRPNTPTSAPCDAISFSLGFTAKPASAGTGGTFPFKTTTCFDGNIPKTLGNYPDNCK